MGKNITRSNEGLQRRFRIRGRELCRLIGRLEYLICNDRLIVEGQRIIIPRNEEIKVEIKFQQDKRNELDIKITWENEQCRRDDKCPCECELDCDNDHDD